MKRLFIGLTLLLMAFLSTLEPLEALHRVAAHAGVQPWMTQLALAAAAVAAFAKRSNLHRRMLFPRQGLRLLLAGIALYALALAALTGVLPRALALVPLEADSAFARLPELVALLRPWPLFLVAQVLLLVGAFRALTNLVPPDEFATDF